MPQKERRSTISLPPDFYNEYLNYFQKHQKTLKSMEITDVSKLIRVAANMGLSKVDELVQTAEKK